MKANLDREGGAQVERRKLMLGAIFCAAAGAAFVRAPSKSIDLLGEGKLEALIPKSLGPWNFIAASGLVIPPEDELSKAIYSQILTRVYSDEQNAPIMLLIAQSAKQTGFLQVHRPEFCYLAGGYQLSAIIPHPTRINAKIIPASSLDASQGGATEHIVYWVRIGNKLPGSWIEQKAVMAELNLRGFIPDAVLVRVSTVGEDGMAARSTIDRFVATLIDSLPQKAQAVLIGA